MKTIAIMGVGWVGGTLARYFDEQPEVSVVRYDPPKGMGQDSDLAAADVIFICLPTPYDEKVGGFDLSYVRKGMSVIPGNKLVVIKSTVLPGTTEMLQKEFPQHRLLFNPEFLRQSTADADFRAPDRQLIGTTPDSMADAHAVMELLPEAPYMQILGATEAETVKYFGNTFLAMKVVFANQVYDLCEKLGISYDTVRNCAAADTRIGDSHLQIVHDGKRGYAGSCFPKDMRAFIQLGDAVGAEMALLKTAERLNQEILARNPAPETAKVAQ